ncbi:DsrE family protein [Pseudodesulfovibrio cashew]|uniref:DsrE family protein n=1 Tax=Pseudodesulfovibrio cashew TaxID=2678688 RepID=A0A6I6JCW2_9BACT|nr:DsrE family protein [Pseudodesulfovibrio cashew]QGY40645.1 DsrE family protein [Pseudodesulfovibrio cashew]
MSPINPEDSLFIIWSSADPEVAHNLAFMYAHNSLARGWWDNVRLVIWGPSAKLASHNAEIQEKLTAMMHDGVEIWACRACADNYGVTPDLEALGISVIYVGEPVTAMIKSGWEKLTF